MLSDFTGADRIYIACGYTDLRKGIDALASLDQQQFNLDPFSNTLFLFCGRRRDRIKALYWEGNGFVLAYKRLEKDVFQWPRDVQEVRQLTPQQYRWLMEGLKLSRQTMANWILNASDTWLRPVYDVLHRNLCRKEVLHGDETVLQVLKEAGKAATSKSYMWLYRTSGCAENPIVLYEYQPNRKAENAENFLKGFSGWLHADGYQGYHKLPDNIRVVGCWAHARRKFDEALYSLPEDKRKGSSAATGLCYCTNLFRLEEAFEDLTPEERTNKRLELAKPVLDALSAWANSLIAKTPPKSALGKALHYLLEQWPYLIRYLEDGRLELSNNRAERSIKPFVMGRKNWLFANTTAGAQSSAVIYSLIETAKENRLDPYRYLLWVLREAPALSQNDDAWAEKLLPANAPQDCCTPAK